ncbi:hypothetical protein Bhyg_09263 [Pseudolycoriella hygida]|uniref:Uncharacterized protein n=1 Tax=Pseudolycoriella hygida TaxID=35572 RepID=A0A9Q0N646_9DIPT|nr:hypothetical protein Bhyg_09263 [Pseudolycoriella hygida]
MMAESGLDKSYMRRHCGWVNESMAERYIEMSLNNKKKIADKILTLKPKNETIMSAASTSSAPHPCRRRHHATSTLKSKCLAIARLTFIRNKTCIFIHANKNNKNFIVSALFTILESKKGRVGYMTAWMVFQVIDLIIILIFLFLDRYPASIVLAVYKIIFKAFALFAVNVHVNEVRQGLASTVECA